MSQESPEALAPRAARSRIRIVVGGAMLIAGALGIGLLFGRESPMDEAVVHGIWNTVSIIGCALLIGGGATLVATGLVQRRRRAAERGEL